MFITRFRANVQDDTNTHVLSDVVCKNYWGKRNDPCRIPQIPQTAFIVQIHMYYHDKGALPKLPQRQSMVRDSSFLFLPAFLPSLLTSQSCHPYKYEVNKTHKTLRKGGLNGVSHIHGIGVKVPVPVKQ